MQDKAAMRRFRHADLRWDSGRAVSEPCEALVRYYAVDEAEEGHPGPRLKRHRALSGFGPVMWSELGEC